MRKYGILARCTAEQHQIVCSSVYRCAKMRFPPSVQAQIACLSKSLGLIGLNPKENGK